MSPYKPKT